MAWEVHPENVPASRSQPTRMAMAAVRHVPLDGPCRALRWLGASHLEPTLVPKHSLTTRPSAGSPIWGARFDSSRSPPIAQLRCSRARLRFPSGSSRAPAHGLRRRSTQASMDVPTDSCTHQRIHQLSHQLIHQAMPPTRMPARSISAPSTAGWPGSRADRSVGGFSSALSGCHKAPDAM